MAEFKNVKSPHPQKGAKVHKVLKVNWAGVEVSKGGHRSPACDGFHNLDENSGWFRRWVTTDEQITCKNCLRNYYADGRRK